MNGLSPHAREFVSRSAAIPIFVQDGFVPYIPEWDVGIDFILYREFDDLTIKVQLKSRWNIERKYVGRKIGMLFRNDDCGTQNWYLCPHDKMVEYAREKTNYLKTTSWNKQNRLGRETGGYSVGRMSNTMRRSFDDYRLVENGDNRRIYSNFSSA